MFKIISLLVIGAVAGLCMATWSPSVRSGVQSASNSAASQISSVPVPTVTVKH